MPLEEGKEEMMKQLKVDVEDIEIIMENQDRFGNQYYLDTETGETVVIPDELMTAFPPSLSTTPACPALCRDRGR